MRLKLLITAGATCSLLGCLLLLCQSCSRSLTIERGIFHPVPPPVGQIELPDAGATPVRSASAALNVVEGSDYSATEGNQLVLADGDNLQFTPSFAAGSTNPLGTSYAVFGFQQSQYLVAPDLHVEWITPPAGADLWIGYSDYSTGRWLWTQADANVSDFAIADIASMSTPAPESNFYVALLLTGQGQSVLDWLRVGKDLPDDAILAIPNRTSVTAGDTVTVTVFTNKAALPFLFCYECRIVIPASCSIVNGSYNVGAEGGAKAEIDGIWTSVMPTDFVIVDGFSYIPQDLGGGMVGHDFTVTPIGGTAITDATGALFNFELLVNEDVSLGFMTADSTPFLTGYSVEDLVEHKWGDSTNFGMPPIDVL